MKMHPGESIEQSEPVSSAPEIHSKLTPEERLAGFQTEFKILQDFSSPISPEKRLQLLNNLHSRVETALKLHSIVSLRGKLIYAHMEALSSQIRSFKEPLEQRKAA